MASSTTNLELYKKDPLTDGSDTFNITTMLNENWDKIDTAYGTTVAAIAGKQGLITISDTELTPGESQLATGVFYAVYE